MNIHSSVIPYCWWQTQTQKIEQEAWRPNKLYCNFNSTPINRAFKAHHWNTNKISPNKHVEHEWCETNGKYLKKMTEDLNYDLFWDQKWPGIWASKANIQHTSKIRGGVWSNGQTVCSLTGDHRTTNDAWKSSVHKHCHGSPGWHIVTSWRQLLWRHEGDVPEVGSVDLVITKRITVAQRYQTFGTAVSECPGHFLSWLGAVDVFLLGGRVWRHGLWGSESLSGDEWPAG